MTEHVSKELDDLKKEIESFKEEKERVRAIIGQIGGMPGTHATIVNIVFITFVVVCFAISIISRGHLSTLMTDIGIAALSIKLIVLMHLQSKVNHFQLWILSSMEWKINELNKAIKSD